MNAPGAGRLLAAGYDKVAVESGVGAGDPHRLILMLYDGALAAVRAARGHMQERRIAEKGAAIGKATRIVEEGLKLSLDPSSGGEIAAQLARLYDYITLRLLQANLRNEAPALAEVEHLLGELRSAWAQIDRSAAAARSGASQATEPAPAVQAQAGAAEPANSLPRPAGAAGAPALARFLDGSAAVRRVLASA